MGSYASKTFRDVAAQYCYLVYLTTLAEVVIVSNSTTMAWKWRRLLALNITYKTHSKFLLEL